MADVSIQSAKISSLASALNAHSNKENTFVPRLEKGPGLHFREIVRTDGPSLTGSALTNGGKVSIELAKLGLLTRCMLRVRLTISATSTQTMLWARNPAAAILESMELSTNSRVLSKLSSFEIARRINESPYRDAYHRHSGYHYADGGAAYGQPTYTLSGSNITANVDALGVVAAGVSGTPQLVDLYIPILFSVFDGVDASRGIQTGFVESMKLNFQIRPLAKYLSGTATFTQADFQLSQQFVVCESSIQSAVISKQFPAGKSSQFLTSGEEILARKDITPTDGGYNGSNKKHTITAKLTSSSVSLLRGISVYVVPTDILDGTIAKWDNRFIKVNSYKFSGSGRLLVDCTEQEAEIFSLGMHGAVARGNKTTTETPNGAISTAHVDSYREDNILSYYFAMDPRNRSKNSGYLALAGLASQTHEVEFTIGGELTANKLLNVGNTSVLIVGHAIAVKSIQSSSGAVTSSLST